MAELGSFKQRTSYLSIGAVGNKDSKDYISAAIRKEVTEDTLDAIKRDWKVGENSGVKYELAYPDITGKITKVEVVEKEFDKGKKQHDLQVTIDNEITISVKTTNKYGSSLMRQLPEVDLTQPVRLFPYNYTPKGKENPSVGVSIKQGENFDVKVADHYRDFDKGEDKNGMPQPDFKWGEQEDWQKDKYWAEVDAHLRAGIIEKVTPNVPEFTPVVEEGGLEDESFVEDVNPEDVPF